jgi:uncharacterized repeat protein (TIGR01451 family)
VLNRADLQIGMTTDQEVYKPSSVVIYTITVTNNGPSDAASVVVTDVLPDVKQLSYLFDSGGCAVAGQTVSCGLGTIAAGGSVTFNLHVLVKGKKGKIDNTATVASATFDQALANNSVTRSILIGK